MTDMMVVYVVGFSPDFTHWHGDTVRVGGFDWRPSWNDAAALMREHLEQGETGHDYVFRAVQVPRTMTRDQVTEYLNGEGNRLLEIPLPEEWAA